MAQKRNNRARGRGISATPNLQNSGSATATIERTDTVIVPRVPNVDPQAPLASTSLLSSTDQSTTIASEASLMLEYIMSTGPRTALQFAAPFGTTQAGGIHVLPIYIDELERDFGTDMYLRMLNDATVKSVDAVLRDGILDRPIQISSPIDDDDTTVKEGKRKYAQNIATFVQKNLDDLRGGFMIVAREMLEAIIMGYKLAEQVYETREIISGNGPQTVLESLNPKPQEAVSMVADAYNHVLGYTPRQSGWGMSGVMLYGELGLQTLEDGRLEIPGLIPPEKVARFTWNPRNDDARGQSHGRAIYIMWRLKIGVIPAWEAYLARFAQPSAVLELNGADIMPMPGPDGRLLKDPVAILNALMFNLRNWQAGGALVLPIGEVRLEQPVGNGQAYLSALEYIDEQITQGYLNSNLSTQGGKYGTQALGEVHQDTQGLLFQYGKYAFAQFVRYQIIYPLVYYNYGDEGLQYLPTVTFGGTEQQDFGVNSTAYASLMGAGLLFPPQFNEMFEKLGITPLDDDVMALLVEKWKAGLKADTAMANQAATPQMGPDGQPLPPGQAAPPADPSQQDPAVNYYDG